MKSKLLLYIDTNIIVPVSCDPSGRTHETESILYNGIIDLSHIEIIQDFYQKTTGVNTIDTHFVFAETIETPLKKKIMETFSKEGIKPVSFTSPALAGGFFSTTWEARRLHISHDALSLYTIQPLALT